ncbi:MAG: hypothetical protein ABIH34_02605 [Nanoarchaeota archaeon]
MKPLILFDVGAVLLQIDYSRFTDLIATLTGKDASVVTDELTNSGIEQVYFTQGSAQGMVNAIGDLYKISTEDAEEAFSRIWVGPTEIVKIKDNLIEDGYRIGLLSNISALAHKQISSLFPSVLQVNGPSYLSFKISAVKPDKAIYDEVQEEPVIFIDDKKSYLVPAKNKGWSVILYTGHIDLTETARQYAPSVSSSFPEAKTAEQLERMIRRLS